MMKSPFQFKMKNMLLVVALLAAPMLLLKRLARNDTRVVYLSGTVHVQHDGSVEVQGGGVRVIRDDTQTEIQADRIVVQKDGTAGVEGGGTIRQTTR